MAIGALRLPTGASQICKLPLRLEVWGYCIPSPPARTNTSTLPPQHRVCVAALA